ncbi:maleylacetate reductase [Falsigemmobacter faecalis]|uniref:Maleylacetate reductase n=1 Tax=Falsigemmobacter faecalis TaxID=2488730 RepID=A0A3P3D711_9RHOB|nr:maleylacetate reductase [Falsigemmobacter faecalis]RRH69346.1 maleylacetate reductase [Falsigemmobacter faecalis]
MSYYSNQFTAQSAQVRVRFGAGLRRSLGEELERGGFEKALLLTTSFQSDLLAEFEGYCGGRCAGSFSKAEMHTPVAISEEAADYARACDADVVIAIGGGSTTGLAKAIALRTGLPQIILPTTYAGSEATPVLGQTENGLKTTLSSPKVQPGTILYDPELITGLPLPMTVTSALNAMAHAVEGLYARDRSPIASLMAVEGLRAFQSALPRVLADPRDLTARGETLYGAWLCGTVLGQVGMALHHKLCHTLGGSFGVPHAETHAVILPHAVAFNAPAAQEALRPLTDLMGHDNPGLGLWHFAQSLGAPMALRDLGLAESDLDRAADLSVANPYWNPRSFTRDEIRALLQPAWEGRPPAA